MMLKFAKLSQKAAAPHRATEGAAGFDLTSAEAGTVKPGERRLFKTDLAFELPAGTYGQVAGRSGLALKHGIQVLAGVIDSDYRGNVGALLLNMGDKPFHGMLAQHFCALHLLQTPPLSCIVAVGDRIAQLLVLKTAEIEDVVEKRKLSKSARADAGFGSTGVATRKRKLEDEETTTEEEESATETEAEESGTETTTTEDSGIVASMDDETTTDADYEPSSDEDM